MSNSLDPDQARRFVGPDLGPNCLPRLSADDTGRQRVKHHYAHDHRQTTFAHGHGSDPFNLRKDQPF